MPTVEVQAKREAAQRWVNYVNDDDQVYDHWGYLLLAQSDIKASKGSWPSMKGFGV